MCISRFIKNQASKGKKVLMFFLFAGHGMMRDNGQVLLTNDFDKGMQFYKMFKAEPMLRTLSASAQNAYAVSLFACCRQKFDAAAMCHCFDSATAEALEEKFRTLAEYKHQQEEPLLQDDLSDHDAETK